MEVVQNDRSDSRPVFSSSFDRTLDDKSRFALPPRFRAQIEKIQETEEVIYIFYNIVCREVVIFTRQDMEDTIRPMLDDIKDARKRRKMHDLIYSCIEDQTLDGQGRLKLNPRHLKTMEFDKNIVVTGADHVIKVRTAAAVEAQTIEPDEEEVFINLTF